MNTLLTPKELQKAFTYMFVEKGCLGYCVSLGWFPVFGALCRTIDVELGHEKGGFHWVQLKEKFGSPRWYYEFEQPQNDTHIDSMMPNEQPIAFSNEEPCEHPAEKAVRMLIKKANAAASAQCIVCGAPGEIDRQGGYCLMLCSHHLAMRKRNRDGLKIWFAPSVDFSQGPQP